MPGKAHKAVHAGGDKGQGDRIGCRLSIRSRGGSGGVPAYLILVSRNSTCFLAIGSYFFFTIFSV
jgi:hypothetical protein